jgi:hypothetical protein
VGVREEEEEAVLGCRGGPGIRNLRAEMTAVFTLAAAASSETSMVRQEPEDVAYAGRWLLLSPTA